MAKTKFVLDFNGVGKLLRSKNTMKVCEAFAEEVADRAGEGFEVTQRFTGKRAVVRVAPVTEEAAQDNFDHNTLLKALNK